MAVTLKVERRAIRPRSIRKQLRVEGRVPGVVYGNDVENTSLSVDAMALSKAIRENGANAVYYLELEGKKVPTLVHDYQVDTFNGDWVHVEFLAVDMSEETEVEAEIVLIGDAPGVKAGGVLTQTLYNVVVSATPDKLPETVEVDVSGLEIGDNISVADLPKFEDFTIVTEAEEQIASVTEPEVHEEPETDGEVAEPEVIGEDKEEA